MHASLCNTVRLKAWDDLNKGPEVSLVQWNGALDGESAITVCLPAVTLRFVICMGWGGIRHQADLAVGFCEGSQRDGLQTQVACVSSCCVAVFIFRHIGTANPD